jgi:hypothetical protein
LPVLIFETGPAKGTTVRLESDRIYVFGRDEAAEVQIDSELASRVHAKLRGKDGRYFLKDSESSNGTYVNDVRIRGVHELSSGDRIMIGTEVVSFLDDADASGAGRTLGGFQLIQRLGRGGMGTVYRAMQKSLNREVALKILSPELSRDPKFVAQFFKEARAAGQLNHPNIVQVYDVETDGGLVFFAMEYMTGGSVEDRILRDGALPLDQALAWLLDAARGLEYAEIKRLVHRDIKPDNLMLTEMGSVKIADLGLAMASHEGHEKGAILGTPHFISPEQARGDRLDTRSDLYSLGATVFRMLTGETPFHGETAEEILRKQVREPAPSVRSKRPEVPEKVAQIVARLLAKDPAERYQTAGELIAAIEAARAGGGRGGAVAAAVFAIAALTAGAGWFLGWFDSPAQDDRGTTTVIVKDEEDAEKARRLAEQLATQERETLALGAISDLAMRQSTLEPQAYLAELERLAEEYAGTAAAGRLAPDIAARRADLERARQLAAELEQATAAARQALVAKVDAALAIPDFTAALAAADAASTRDAGSANGAEPIDLTAEREAQRARIAGLVAESSRATREAVAAALAADDHAAANAALDAAWATLGMPPPDAATEAAEIAAWRAELLAERERTSLARRAFDEARLAADLVALLDARAGLAPLFAKSRHLEAADPGSFATLQDRLATEEYRAIASHVAGDLGAHAATMTALRTALESGKFASSRIQLVERDLVADVVGLAPDGKGVIVEVARGVGRSRSTIGLDSFDDLGEYVELLTGRADATPQAALAAARGAIWHAAARLHPQIDPALELLRGWNSGFGFSAEQRSRFAALVPPQLDVAKIEPWLRAAESDPSLAAAATEQRSRLAREARALETIATAFASFAGNSSGGTTLAADQLEAMRTGLRDTLVFYVAYPLFDGGKEALHLARDPGSPQ